MVADGGYVNSVSFSSFPRECDKSCHNISRIRMTTESLEWPIHRGVHETHPPEKECLMGPSGLSWMGMKSSSLGRESWGRSGSLK